MLAGSGEHISDLDVLRNSPGLFGQVPIKATVSRFMEQTADQREASTYGFEILRQSMCSRMWEADGTRNRPTWPPDWIPRASISTLVHAHLEKEDIADTYKGGDGFSPMIASVDYAKENVTREIRAAEIRPGSKSANSADHIKILAQARAQLPDDFYG